MLSLSALLTANLAGAVEQLMMDAQTPHFMQMHTGAPGITKLEAFAKDNANVADFQVLNFLNLNNAHISIGGNSLPAAYRIMVSASRAAGSISFSARITSR